MSHALYYKILLRQNSPQVLKRTMWHVYLLLCKDKNIYTGITNNLPQRLQHHKDGTGGRYTRSHKPTKILYSEIHKTRSAALKREAEIKQWRREKKLNFIKRSSGRTR